MIRCKLARWASTSSRISSKSTTSSWKILLYRYLSVGVILYVVSNLLVSSTGHGLFYRNIPLCQRSALNSFNLSRKSFHYSLSPSSHLIALIALTASFEPPLLITHSPWYADPVSLYSFSTESCHMSYKLPRDVTRLVILVPTELAKNLF